MGCDAQPISVCRPAASPAALLALPVDEDLEGVVGPDDLCCWIGWATSVVRIDEQLCVSGDDAASYVHHHSPNSFRFSFVPTHQGVNVALLVHLDLGHVLRVLLLPLARHRVAVPEDEVHLYFILYVGWIDKGW